MDSSKISIKFFFQTGTAPHSEAVVPMFHRWIQTHALAEHQLVDVADYQHVVAGPGTVLVAHEANITTDSSENKPGLIYIRKTPLAGDFSQRLLKAFEYALQGCKLLEEEGSFQPKPRFRTNDLVIRIHDRLEAPNTAETFKELEPALTAFAQRIFGQSVQLSHVADEKKLFEVRISAQTSDSIGKLLSRVASPAAPVVPAAQPPEYFV